MVPPPSRTALILAHGRDRGAVTAARALDRAGWRVEVGSSDPDGGLVGASGSVARVHHIPRPRGGGSDFVSAVRDAHAQGGHDLLFGSGDDWLAAAVHHQDELPVPLAHPDATVVDAATDKLRLAELAAEVGLPPLDTRALDGHTVPDGTLPQGWRFPVVVKNRRHWLPGNERPLRVETRICQSPEELIDQITVARAHGDEPIVQRHVTGRLGALIGLMHGGQLTGRIQQVSPRLWPTPAGASARALTIPVDQDLADRCEQLLRSMGWTGLVELQFLIDDGGAHRLIDFNGRFFGSLALSERARPGLVAAWADSALGHPTRPLADGRPGLRYQWLPGDLRRAVHERRGGLVLDVLDTLRWAVTAQHSILRANDLGPARQLLKGRRVSSETSLPAGGHRSRAADDTQSA